MNKNDFLKKLSKLLHMLKEEEVKDILNEYEQHIDMRVAQGLTEEEATSAFGTVEELAAEVLDAYHIKADFKPKKKIEVVEKVQTESKKVIRNAGEAGKSFWDGFSNKIKTFGLSCEDGIKKGAVVCKRWILAPFVFLKNIFGEDSKREERRETEPMKENKRRSIGSGVLGFFHWIIRVIKKIWYGCFLVLFGTAGVTFLLLLGFLLVLLILGYPVIGITIGLLGAAMAVNAAAYYVGSKWRRI